MSPPRIGGRLAVVLLALVASGCSASGAADPAGSPGASLTAPATSPAAGAAADGSSPTGNVTGTAAGSASGGPSAGRATASGVPITLRGPARPVPATPGAPFLTYLVGGGASGVQAQVLVRLPPSYFDPQQATRRFPVIETFHGAPGHAGQWLGKLHLGSVVDQRAAQGLLAEAIVVSPDLNGPDGGDHECVDGAPGQPRLETWATHDVPAWVEATFRASTDPSGWATFGLSAGGWCAAMATVLHPQQYSAAVVLSGYFRPLFSGPAPFPPGSTPARRYDLPALVGRDPPPVHVWLVTSTQDGESLPTSRQFQAAARAPLTVDATVLSRQDHSWTTWRESLPAALAWLARVSPGFAPAG